MDKTLQLRMRLRYQQKGSHFHCRLFTARRPNSTFAKCGDLSFDEREWPQVKALFEAGGAEVWPEGFEPSA